MVIRAKLGKSPQPIDVALTRTHDSQVCIAPNHRGPLWEHGDV